MNKIVQDLKMDHIIIKTLNVQNKQTILKATSEKGQVTYKGRIICNFSTETLKARTKDLADTQQNF